MKVNLNFSVFRIFLCLSLLAASSIEVSYGMKRQRDDSDDERLFKRLNVGGSQDHSDSDNNEQKAAEDWADAVLSDLDRDNTSNSDDREIATLVGEINLGSEDSESSDDSQNNTPFVATVYKPVIKLVPLRQAVLQAVIVEQPDDEDFDAGLVMCASISPDGQFLATGDGNGYVRIWDVCTGKLFKELEYNLPYPVSLLKWSPDSKYLMAFADDLDSNFYPELVFWKRDHLIFEHCRTVQILEGTIADFALKKDLTSIIVGKSMSTELFSCNSDDSDFNLVATNQYDEDVDSVGMCISADEKCCIRVVTNEHGSTCELLGLDDALKTVPGFSINARCIACDSSSNNHLLLLAKTGVAQEPRSIQHFVMDGNCFYTLPKLETCGFSLKDVCYSSDSSFIIGIAPQQGNSMIRSPIRPYCPAALLVWSCSGGLLMKLMINDLNADSASGFNILDAQTCGTVLTVVVCDDSNVWTISLNLVNTFQVVQKMQRIGYNISVANTAQCQSLMLELDEDGTFWVKRL